MSTVLLGAWLGVVEAALWLGCLGLLAQYGARSEWARRHEIALFFGVSVVLMVVYVAVLTAWLR